MIHRINRRLPLVAGAAAFLFLSSCLPAADPAVHAGPTGTAGELVHNGGFESRAGNLPADWKPEPKAAGKGSVEVSAERMHSGTLALKLTPNGKNTEYDLSHNPLGLGQAFPAGPVRGKKLYLSAWLAAQDGATAVVQLLYMKTDGSIVPVRLAQASGGAGFAHREDVLPVPDDARINYVILLALAEGTQGTAWIDDVQLTTTPPAPAVIPPPVASGPMTATVEVDASRTLRRIPESLFGTNLEWIWDGNSAWNADQGRLDPTLIGLSRELGVTVQRFPGGIFADFYHWKDGVGPRAARKETIHYPGGPKSVHRFGTEEELDFAAQTGGSLMITVNMVTGTPEEAAEWVRFTNKSGRNSAPVRYWELGNEQYVRDNSAHNKPATMDPEKYAGRFLVFARAMRAVDPSIQLGILSDANYGHIYPHPYRDWNDKVFRIAGQEADFVAVHCAYAPGIWMDKGWPVRTVYTAMLAAPAQVKEALEAVNRSLEKNLPGRAGRMQIAVTEWGPYFQVEPSGRFLDHVKTLASALYVASTLKAFCETPRTDIANFFKLNDRLWQGSIGQRKGIWTATAPYFAFQMFTRHFGRELVSSRVEVEGFNSPEVGTVDPGTNVPYLDVIASRSIDGKTLYVLAINKHFDRDIRARIALTGFKPGLSGTAWTLNGRGIDANTGTELFQAPGANWARQAVDEAHQRFDRGGPGEISMTTQKLTRPGETLEWTFQAHSVTSLEIPGR